MKKLQKLAIVLICFFVACNEPAKENAADPVVQKYHELEQASWLLGMWGNTSERGNSIESWEKANDSTYLGSSFFIVGKDTVSSESISLVQMNDRLFYIPTVKNQNGGQPVPFKSTAVSDSQLVFENPEHDFPQKITYKKISGDSLLAVISAVVNGKEKAVQFPMARTK